MLLTSNAPEGHPAQPLGRRWPHASRPDPFPAAVLALATLFIAASVPHAHAQGIPGVAPNKCPAGKNKCMAKKIADLMKCSELCEKDPDKCGQVQAECVQKVDGQVRRRRQAGEGLLREAGSKAAAGEARLDLHDDGRHSGVEAQVDALVDALLATVACTNTCLNGGTLKADCSCTCPSGYESLNGGCFRIANDLSANDCAPGCQARAGSVSGSGNFLCTTFPASGACSSTSDCPLGSACQLDLQGCLAQCTSP